MKRPQAQAAKGSTSVDLLALAEYVEQFSSKTVVVLGDFVADEFQFGEISRVSREAPGPDPPPPRNPTRTGWRCKRREQSRRLRRARTPHHRSGAGPSPATP